MCVCIYIHDRFTIFVVLLLLAFCSQSAWNIVVTLTSLCFSLIPLANDNPKDLLRFLLLPQLYDLGKMDLEMQFIFDLRSDQLRHDEVLLNRSSFRAIHYQRL